MKNKTKRIVSAICALAMCAAIVPAAAFAAGEAPVPDPIGVTDEATEIATVTVKFVDENNKSLGVDDKTVEATVGDKLYESGELLSAVNSVDGYIFQNFSWSAAENAPESSDSTVASGKFTLYAHMKKLDEVKPETATVTVKFVDENNKSFGVDDKTVEATVGDKLYESEELLSAVNSVNGYIFQNFTWSAVDNAPEEGDSTVTSGKFTLYAHMKKLDEVKPEHTTTINIKQQYVDGDVFATIEVGTIPYEDATYLPYVDVIAPYFEDSATYTYAGYYDVSINGMDAHRYGHGKDVTMVQDATMDVTIYYNKVDPEPEHTTTINIKQQYVDGETFVTINVGTIPYEDATYLPDVDVIAPYFEDTDTYTYAGYYDVSINGMEANRYGTGNDVTMVQDATMDVTIYYNKVNTAPSEDVNFRVEYVDANNNALLQPTVVGTTYNDFEPSQKLVDLIADQIAQVEADGYKQVAFTLVLEDGYETTPLDEPYIVPDFDGKTIKVYFEKVEQYEDVNVRFHFVDMDGNSILADTVYGTSLNDSIVGPKVADVLADEIDKLATEGYNFDHFAWVHADGSEATLTDPVVVPDYHNTVIKVYFTKVEEYTDVHVRFEFVDMDGNTVLPATNYATCLSDSVIGDKVANVLADEMGIMAGRNYTFHHFAWVYPDGTETTLDDPIVVPDYDNTVIKAYFVAPQPTASGTVTVTATPAPDEHPDIAEGIANGTWGGAPTATPAQTMSVPQTSDSLPMGALIVVAIVAAGAVCGLVVLRKRGEQ